MIFQCLLCELTKLKATQRAHRVASLYWSEMERVSSGLFRTVQRFCFRHWTHSLYVGSLILVDSFYRKRENRNRKVCGEDFCDGICRVINKFTLLHNHLPQTLKSLSDFINALQLIKQNKSLCELRFTMLRCATDYKNAEWPQKFNDKT